MHVDEQLTVPFLVDKHVIPRRQPAHHDDKDIAENEESKDIPGKGAEEDEEEECAHDCYLVGEGPEEGTDFLCDKEIFQSGI